MSLTGHLCQSVRCSAVQKASSCSVSSLYRHWTAPSLSCHLRRTCSSIQAGLPEQAANRTSKVVQSNQLPVLVTSVINIVFAGPFSKPGALNCANPIIRRLIYVSGSNFYYTNPIETADTIVKLCSFRALHAPMDVLVVIPLRFCYQLMRVPSATPSVWKSNTCFQLQNTLQFGTRHHDDVHGFVQEASHFSVQGLLGKHRFRHCPARDSLAPSVTAHQLLEH